MHAPAGELWYLGEVAQIDQTELTAMYLSLRKTELALIGVRLGGGIKSTNKLKILNYKKAMRRLDMGECHKEIKNKKAEFDKYNVQTLLPWSLQH
jgi:hypothetical protein